MILIIIFSKTFFSYFFIYFFFLNSQCFGLCYLKADWLACNFKERDLTGPRATRINKVDIIQKEYIVKKKEKVEKITKK